MGPNANQTDNNQPVVGDATQAPPAPAADMPGDNPAPVMPEPTTPETPAEPVTDVPGPAPVDTPEEPTVPETPPAA